MTVADELPARIEPDTFLPLPAQIDRVRRALKGEPVALAHFDVLAGQLPAERIGALVERHGRASGMRGALKYLDCPFWVAHKLRFAIRLGLDRRPPARVLDLGMGGGHFSFVCRYFGHEAIGIDAPDPLYADICEALAARRIDHRIRRGEALPDLGGGFDVVTAFASQFDHLGKGEYWSAADWIAFLDGLFATQMTGGGLLYFRVNRAFDAASGAFHPKHQLAEVARHFSGAFESQGGVLELRAPARR